MNKYNVLIEAQAWLEIEAINESEAIEQVRKLEQAKLHRAIAEEYVWVSDYAEIDNS